jgi:hypothetical protein
MKGVTRMPEELSQEDLINYVALAIEALKPTLGHRMLIKDIGVCG